MMGISLIMATFNRLDQINLLVESLERQTSRAFELIIADQNPEGFLEPVLLRLDQGGLAYSHIVTSVRGLSTARNNALPHASFEIIGYPDDDCWYEKDVVERVIEYFTANEEVDGVVGRWCEWDRCRRQNHPLQLAEWKKFRIGIAGSSICLFIRRNMIEKVSGFDEKLGVPQEFGAGEEIDLVMRCLEAGAVFHYVPEIKVHHPVRTCGRSSNDLEEVRRRSRGTGALYRKHNISWSVIGRGFMSQVARLLVPPYSIHRVKRCVSTIMGRLEGMRRWETGEQGKGHCSAGN
jgi:glycosyltransferase involved in cell wall biosynthesis